MGNLTLRRRVGLAAAAALAAVSTLPAARATAEEIRPLAGIHNDDGRLADGKGRTVVLRGVNSVDKTGWTGALAAPILSSEDIATIAALGFNHVRLGTTWASVEHDRGTYDEAYLDQLVGVLDGLAEAGLLAIVDMHQDVWSKGVGGNGAPSWADPQCNKAPNPDLAGPAQSWFAQYASPAVNVAWANFWNDGYGPADLHCTGPIQTAFAAMWRHVAARLAGHPAVVGYDLLNEPWPTTPPGVFEQTQLLPMYKRVAAEIRQVDPSTPIFFGPPIYSPAAPTVAFEPPDPNAVFAPHIYTETMFSGGYISTGARSDELALQKDLADGARMGVPIWVGEWGEVRSDTYTIAMYDLFDRYGASEAYWRYNQRPGETNLVGHEAAHTRVYPEAYPGKATWSFDAAARRFELILTVGPGAQEVQLVVPASLGLVADDPSVRLVPAQDRAIWTVHGPGTFTMSLAP